LDEADGFHFRATLATGVRRLNSNAAFGQRTLVSGVLSHRMR
jgi:hypothetical protein